MSPSSRSAVALDELERRVIDHAFRLQPSYAVGLGLHEYDGIVPDFRRSSTDAWAADADRLLGELSPLDDRELPPTRVVDRILLRLLLESPLFDLRDARELDRNPMAYVGAISLTAYIARDYAPVAARVTAILRTLDAVPGLLAEGRRRLAPPLPKPFVELALAIGGGLPAHFGEAEEFAARDGLGPKVAAARAHAEPAVAEFLDWLRNEELPRATPEFALGAARYQTLLRVREGIETPFAEVERAGAADLARNQARLAAIATSSRKTLAELFQELNADHPAADGILPLAREFVAATKQFVLDRRLATVPEPATCRVEETPVWGRALSTASLNPPGPFDTTSSEGIYYVTPVDPKWTPTQQAEWLRSFNRSMLGNVTVHEVYPGHYLQFLHFRRADGGTVRRVYLSPSFVEGWAHYTEQLAVEQGFGAPSPFAEVAQIHDALLRDCRLLASVGLHTGGMSLEAATQLFQREAHLERLPAEREAIRGTFNPEYFCYTLGKLAILDARAKYLGPRFHGNLSAFHDALLASGSPPIGLIDRLLAAAP